jgi:hypothetical protein
MRIAMVMSVTGQSAPRCMVDISLRTRRRAWLQTQLCLIWTGDDLWPQKPHYNQLQEVGNWWLVVDFNSLLLSERK